MKQAAILIYDRFCHFEISVLLEIFALTGKPFVVFAQSLQPLKSEEGLTVLPQRTIRDVCVQDFDCLVLPGASDIRSAIEDADVLGFIRKFDLPDVTIAAISIAPILLLKAGMLRGKPFMAGVNACDLYEEGFSPDDLALMTGWDDSIAHPVASGSIVSGNTITSVSYNFVRWALCVADALGLPVPPSTFGL